MATPASRPPHSISLCVDPLRDDEVHEADTIFRNAFGTFLGLPNPAEFMAGAQLVQARWLARPDSALGAHARNQLVGCNFATIWGSFGFFGPLAVRPDWWGRGVAQRLLEATLPRFAAARCTHVGLFTFPHSPMHVALYQKFGFRPGALTAVMAKAPEPSDARNEILFLSGGDPAGREAAEREMREIGDSLYPGLDLVAEARTLPGAPGVEVLLLPGGSGLSGFAICHCGAGCEAERGTCYVKFAAVRCGARAGADFVRLLRACERFAAERGALRLVAGVNTARAEAYEEMLARGFRTEILGLAMHRPNEAGYNRRGCYALDDWR